MTTDPSAEHPSGDRTEAFLRLLTANERRLSAFVLALVPHWADADEIVQETKIRLWQQFDEYRPGESFAAWACAIAKFQVLTYRKRVGRERSRFSDAFAEAVAKQIAETEYVTTGEAALADCLQKLNPRNREIVRRYYAGEAQVEEMAQELSRTASSIYKAISAARKFLHECVQQVLDRQSEAGGAAHG